MDFWNLYNFVSRCLRPRIEKEVSGLKLREIPLATKRGNQIRNDQQNRVIQLGRISAYKKMMEKYPLVLRKGYSSNYNCHGMTFASRRTGIYEVNEVNKIIT